MREKPRFQLLSAVAVVTALAAALSGCYPRSLMGTLTLVPKYNEEETLDRLTTHWQDYRIHYQGPFPDNPIAIVFDPRQGIRSLSQGDWIPAKDRKTVSEVVGWIRHTRFYPRLHRVLGPDGQFYGYLYLAWDSNVRVRQIKEHVLRVSVSGFPLFVPL